MNAYLPNPRCLTGKTTARQDIVAARKALTSHCRPATAKWQLLGISIEVTGVGFWNAARDTRGALPNGAELRPVTRLRDRLGLRRGLMATAASTRTRLGLHGVRARLRRTQATAVVAKRRVRLALFVLLLLLAAVLATGTTRRTMLYHSAEDRYLGLVCPAADGDTGRRPAHVDEETGVRGYMITADRRSLKPYFDGRAARSRTTSSSSRRSRRTVRSSPRRMHVLEREIARSARLLRSPDRLRRRRAARAAARPEGGARQRRCSSPRLPATRG